MTRKEFYEKTPVHLVNTLGAKDFTEFALSRTVFKINMFLRFTKKFKIATKYGRKIFLGKVAR